MDAMPPHPSEAAFVIATDAQGLDIRHRKALYNSIALPRRGSGASGERRHRRERFARMQTPANRDVFVAVADERPVGFVTVASNTFHERMGVIDIIGVDPAYQRRGISSRLTEVAIDHMRREGMDIAVVETGGDPGHAPARAAYEEAGFTLLPISRYF